jgi:hypothetical protein
MKTFTTIILGALAIYILPFFLWILLMSGCLDYENFHGRQECNGQDSLTKVVRVIYKPIINLL